MMRVELAMGSARESVQIGGKYLCLPVRRIGRPQHMKPVLVPDECRPRLFTGVAEAAAPAYLEQLARTGNAAVTIILARAAKQADALAEDLVFYHQLATGGKSPVEVLIYPEMPEMGGGGEQVAGVFERQCDRLAVLAALAARRGMENGKWKMDNGGGQRDKGTEGQRGAKQRSTLNVQLLTLKWGNEWEKRRKGMGRRVKGN